MEGSCFAEGGPVMTAVQSHLSTAELEHRYKTASEAIAKSHFHALWLLTRGYSIDQVAGLLSFSTRWVRILIDRNNEGGPDRLGDQRAHNGTEPAGVGIGRRSIHLMMAGYGRGRRSHAGSPISTGSNRCTTSVAGMPSSPLVGRSSSRVLDIRRRRASRIDRA